MSEFEPHDFFDPLKKKQKPYISRQVFQEHVQCTYDKIRDLHTQTELLHAEIEENELARESAESVRVVNEEERISKDSERDSKIYSLGERVEENKEDLEQHKLRYVEQVEVPITNLIENGDFSDGLTGWTAGTMGSKIEPLAEGGAEFSFRYHSHNPHQLCSIMKDNVYYAQHKIKEVAEGQVYAGLIFGFGSGQTREQRFGGYATLVEAQIVSAIVTANDNYTSFMPITTSSNNAVTISFIVDGIKLINLTQTFGVGNEPTQEEMDELIELIGWFDGEITLTQKQQLIWTLKLIRKNRNAITALGGGIV